MIVQEKGKYLWSDIVESRDDMGMGSSAILEGLALYDNVDSISTEKVGEHKGSGAHKLVYTNLDVLYWLTLSEMRVDIGSLGFRGGVSGKELTYQCRRCKRCMWVQSLGQEDLLEEGMTTHFSILAGESHGQRILVGYSPWGRKELDTTEAT